MYSLRSTGSLELIDEDTFRKYSKLVTFEETFRDPEDNVAATERIGQAIFRKMSQFDIKMSLVKCFPIIETFQTYTLKDLPSDIIAGMTSGVMMIPQGMAFAALSTLPPIVGLYISFFASVTYFILGTGRQLSWGCIAVLSLMMATILDKYDSTMTANMSRDCYPRSEKTGCNKSLETNFIYITSSSSNVSAALFEELCQEHNTVRTSKRLEVASGVSIIAGLVLVAASRLGLSKVTNVMSNSLITGFTVGISFHVLTSQMKTMFGISSPRYSGLGAVIKTWISIFQNLPETNMVTLATSIISIMVLYLVKRCINDRFKKHMRIPVPIELLVVIVATLISNFAYLHDNFNVKVVQTVPIGVPAPKFPDLSLVTDYIGDAIIIIVIAYAQTLAMAKTMGLKNNYVVDSNQEMLACGMCSIVCGLFSGYICAASVSRSVVQDGAGGKTQVASLVAASLVLLVIMLIGPYFYHLPMCVLAAIIVVNLHTIFLKLLDLPTEWRRSRYDCAVWVCSFLACIILNVDLGLLVGVIFSLLLIALRSMLAPVVEVGQIPNGSQSAELRSLGNYSCTARSKDVTIMKVTTPLYFANAEIFTSQVFSKLVLDPLKIGTHSPVRSHCQHEAEVVDTVRSHCQHEAEVVDTVKSQCQQDCQACAQWLDKDETGASRTLILDVGEVTFIDLMGVEALEFVLEKLAQTNMDVLITSVSESIIPILQSTGFWARFGQQIFLSVESALSSAVVESALSSAVTSGCKS